MQIKLLCSRSGNNFTQAIGQVIEVDDDEGLRMIEAGQAELVVAKPETATKKVATEKAVEK